MSSVRFSARPSGRRIAVLIGLFSAAISGLGAYIGIPYYLSNLPTSFDEWTGLQSALTISILVLFVAVTPITLIRIVDTYRLAGPDRNFLLLDEGGLNYVRHGESRHWPWSALPVFRMVPRWYGQIQFVLPKDEIKSDRRDPWVHETTPDGPVAVIHDIYDAPIDEIAAKLNAYRDRALQGVGATTTG